MMWGLIPYLSCLKQLFECILTQGVWSITTYTEITYSIFIMKCIASRNTFGTFSFTLKCRGDIYPRSNGSTNRAMATLCEKHKAFLDIVREQGTGSITLKYDHPKCTATLSFSNQSVRNAISGKMMFQLAKALDDLIDDGSERYRGIQKQRSVTSTSNDEIIGLIVRSPGIAFSAGADLSLVTDIGK